MSSPDEETEGQLELSKLSHSYKRVAFACAVLVVLLAFSSIGYINQRTSNQALKGEKHTQECVNTTLATRNGPAANDVDAQINTDTALLNFLKELISEPKTLTVADFQALEQQYSNSLKTLEADKAERNKTPLGKC